MKTVYLLRHAKSSWSNPELEDLERPLNKRGKRNAIIMGERFAAGSQIVDRIISSPARRARFTAELFATACGFPPGKIVGQAELYFCGTRAMENTIKEQDDRYQSIMLVTHNPDITNFVNSIASAPYIENVPTCGLVKLVSEIDFWRDWSASATRFEYFDYPKKSSA